MQATPAIQEAKDRIERVIESPVKRTRDYIMAELQVIEFVKEENPARKLLAELPKRIQGTLQGIAEHYFAPQPPRCQEILGEVVMDRNTTYRTRYLQQASEILKTEGDNYSHRWREGSFFENIGETLRSLAGEINNL